VTLTAIAMADRVMNLPGNEDYCSTEAARSSLAIYSLVGQRRTIDQRYREHRKLCVGLPFANQAGAAFLITMTINYNSIAVLKDWNK
jgi:hypothetical protein